MPVTVKHGSKKAIPLMKQLWREVFGDSDEFIDTFFSKFYRPSRTFLAFDSGELVSMLYCMDVKARYSGKKYKCAYLYGVATKLTERNQGYFHLLHDRMISELKEKRYNGVLVIPASEPLFNFYKELGYAISLKRYEYALTTVDLEEVKDISQVWLAKKDIFNRSSSGLCVLETEEQFIESRRGHLFFSYGSSYLAFAPVGDHFSLYEIISPEGEEVPADRIHYERSAQLLDLSGKLDIELIDKQKPVLNYLLN